jgi:aspartyl-tRNA(Asn)/glutamyl-tRNA(Gln) amidotransferase subunit A
VNEIGFVRTAGQDLADLSLVDAAEVIRKREASAVELLDACLKNLDAGEPHVNATIWVDREGAYDSARAADAALATGELIGLLHGMPLAHKDMYYQAGRRCTCGSAIRRDFVPTCSATVITRLAAAGAYAYAGLNMAEFAQNGTGHNRHYGDCRNPWNLPYITGGSSSGSGAAVAARFTYAALGSDTGGSIRLPAAANGVSGIKPTQTRVSRYGVMPLSFSADNVGPLARTARDCARIMTVIAGHDPRDPTSADVAVPDYEAVLNGDLRGFHVGVPTTYFFDELDPPVRDACEAALAVLAERGAALLRLPLPMMDAISAYSSVVSRVEGATIHAQWMRERAPDFATHISSRLFASLAIPGAYYVEALSRRGPLLQAFAREVFRQVHVLVTPTIRTCLPTLAETDIDNGPPGTERKSIAISANTRPFNYLGLPAASVPCGFDPNGLPISLQIAGRPFAEGQVLKVADAYQRDTAWHKRRPPIAPV